MPQTPAPRGGMWGIGDFGPEKSIWDAITGNLPDLPGTTLPNRRNAAPAAPEARGPMGSLLDSLLFLPPLNIFNDRGPDATSNSPMAPDPAVLQKTQKDQTDVAPQTIPQDSPMGAGGVMGTLGNVLSPPQATGGGAGNVSIPSSMVSDDAAIKAAMIQAGLSLMTPQWGNGLSQIGQAAGQGAEAFTRTKETGPRDAARELALQKTASDIESDRALSGARVEATATSKERRVKEKADRSTEFERSVKGLGLGPKGAAFLKQRMKSFDDILDADAELDPMTRFQKIVEEAKGMDEAPAVVATPKAPNVGGTETVKATDVTPKVGDVRKGHRFKGGDPGDEKNWVKVSK